MEIIELIFIVDWQLVDMEVGRGDKVQIGLDPWIVGKGLHKIPPQVTQEI